MFKKNRFLSSICAFVVLFISSDLSFSNQASIESRLAKLEGSNSNPWSEVAQSVSPYISLRVRAASSDGDNVIQNSGSRIGLKLKRELNSSINAIGQLEWQVNLTDSNAVFDLDENTNSSLVSAVQTETFATRLGYIGFDFKNFGKLTFGKQWGVYHSVASFTDQFPVLGGTALGIYSAGTDGGLFGTGRAERSVLYRYDHKHFSFLSQVQLQDDVAQQGENFGSSIIVKVAPWLDVGFAFNQSNLDINLVDQVILIQDDPRAIVVGLRINLGNTYIGLGYADQRQTEIGTVAGQTELIDSTGLEFVVRHRLNNEWRLYVGLNERSVDENQRFDSNQNIEDYFIGADYEFDSKSRLFMNARYNQERGVDVLIVGYRLDF